MDQQLKQRLVGLAVIFSLAVIFVPMLLDGPGPEQKTLEVDIPPAPEIIPLPVKVEEKVIELRRETDAIEPLQPRIVDESSAPPTALPAATPEADKIATAGETGSEQGSGTSTAATPAQRKVSPAEQDHAGPEAPAPENDTAAEPEPQPVAAPKPKPKTQPRSEPRAEARPLPAKTPAGGDSFIVQLGSFTDRNKAYALRDRVRKLRLGAVFIEKFARGKTTFYRVRVGPFITRDKARVALNKLRAKYNIKGQVMRYDR